MKKSSKKDHTQKEFVYVVQKHAAKHLHYDLRLEMDGVLKSWAVPKEPSGDPATRRLAVSVEDHQLGYEDFEGEIPKGQYGAGKVEIWDKGTFEIIERNPHKIVVKLKGSKLTGIYCLIKLKPSTKPDKNWLFFKKRP